jgi:hypothetical protein
MNKYNKMHSPIIKILISLTNFMGTFPGTPFQPAESNTITLDDELYFQLVVQFKSI